ncbi:B-cell receptor CD22-like [Dreissena polymorpha]|nr:B-cell receptor CD22-like [Dreissena polymorpha]
MWIDNCYYCFEYISCTQAPVLISNATSVKVNEALKLTCTHPTATVVRWFRQPAGNSTSSLILVMGYTNNACAFVPPTIPDDFSTCVCSGTGFTCILKPLKIINHEDKWKCSVSINTQATFSNEVTLIITVPVVYATLTPEVPVISVLPNVPLSYLHCVSSVGRPSPNITWYLDKLTPSDYSDDVDFSVYSSSSTLADVTTSSLTMTPTLYYQDARVYCNVSNGFGQVMSNRTLKINVLSIPTKPTIMYNTAFVPSNISVIQHSTMTLECASSGNPAPSISWATFNGSLISSSFITIKFSTSNEQEQIVCRANSLLDPTNGSRIPAENTTALNVNILYPPSAPSCQIKTFPILSNSIRAVFNEPFTMTCTSKSNPPPSRYTWTLPYDVKQNGSQLSIQRMQPSNNFRYTLEVVNEMNATLARDVVYGNITDYYTFEILYPVTNLSIYHRGQANQHINIPTISVIKGREVSFGCNAFSNPASRYSWILSGVIVANGTKWNISFVDNTIIGCIATNTLDPTGVEARDTSSYSNVSVNVLFAPEAPKCTFQTCETYSETKHLKVIRGHSVSGRCTSKSEPGSKFLWTPVNSGIDDGFFINNVSRHQSGNYTCIANNEMHTTFDGIINGTNQSSFYLDVLATAYAMFVGNYTVLLNTTLSVTCPFTAGNPPETRFTWFHGNTLTIGSQQNISLSSVKLSNEGYYKCRVNNTMDPTGCATQDEYTETTFYVDVQCE